MLEELLHIKNLKKQNELKEKVLCNHESYIQLKIKIEG